ncbi:MAG: hypothetical protein Q9217_001524 [Psora testacea]
MHNPFAPPSSPFETPSLPHRILSSPLKYLAQKINALYLLLRGSAYTLFPKDHRIRILCISDTHCHKPTSLPPADILIHAGDLTNAGTVDEIQDQVDWLKDLTMYKHKVVIAGNHDGYFDPRSRAASDKEKQIEWGGGVHYLQHSSVTLKFPEKGARQLKVYGAPQVPACGGPEFAFQYPRGQNAWSVTIPDDTDVLVTHTPPKHHLDLPRGMGCEWLLKEVWRVRPRLHVFGHVHCGYGREMVYWDEEQKVFERLCGRLGGRLGADMKTVLRLIKELVSVWVWLDLVRLVVYAVLGVLWSRVWGGNDDETVMLNAALTVGSTGTLGNKPQVVEI